MEIEDAMNAKVETKESLGAEAAEGATATGNGGASAAAGRDNGESRRKGKVARLSAEIRKRINEMIEDGRTYGQIIEQLGEDGKGLTESNVSRWKEGGYKDWQVERAFIERVRARQETPRELVQDFDATEVNHATLQLGTLYIFEALRELGPGSLNEKLGGDCGSFARLINALARASRETMQLQRYREACAKAREMLQQLDPDRKLGERERRAVVRRLDEMLGVAQPLEVLGALEQVSLVVEKGAGPEGPNGEAAGPGVKGEEIGPAAAGSGFEEADRI